MSLQRNLGAVLSALAEESEVNRCPLAKGLYSFLATYRFVAAVYLQADVLPHLACLSKLFQKENVNFLALKHQVPVTIAILRTIRDAGDHQPPGSFLSRLHQDLDNPTGLSSFGVVHEEERNRRHRGSLEEHSREQLWVRFKNQVMEPYLDALVESLERRFGSLDLLGAFHVLGPQAAKEDEAVCVRNLKLLSNKFLTGDQVIQEWTSFRQHILIGAFQGMDQQQIMTRLASQIDEWGQLYPGLNKLAAIGLTIPVSSVNCERDFSTLNRVKTDLRNRLQGEHLATCLRVSINGPPTTKFPYRRALELFFKKPRRIKCSQAGCSLCG
ncbi:uncharacterized protein LOC129116382 [Anoplopoma fimbria]|uniref:uncharacterized protein LOC129116382 n=1 Tax=Anoplopoma fimbria TaxID=229290 RepID=UPI0023EAB617|nr:uncharacterized protein LOC129116382 [Anoplopoma fimbria]